MLMSEPCARRLLGRRRPHFIDTHILLMLDAADLTLRTPRSSAAKALKGLSLAREYMNYGFTTALISTPPRAVSKLQQRGRDERQRCCRSLPFGAPPYKMRVHGLSAGFDR